MNHIVDINKMVTMHRTTKLNQSKRASFKAQGLTCRGFAPMNKPHPELSGLTGSEYHTAYMRWQRRHDRENYNSMPVKQDN